MNQSGSDADIEVGLEVSDGLRVLAVPFERLAIDGAGQLWASIAGRSACVGRAIRGLAPVGAGRLVLVSERLFVVGGILTMMCTRCRMPVAVAWAGLRTMSPVELRNQPRCAPCRHKTKDA